MHFLFNDHVTGIGWVGNGTKATRKKLFPVIWVGKKKSQSGGRESFFFFFFLISFFLIN